MSTFCFFADSGLFQRAQPNSLSHRADTSKGIPWKGQTGAGATFVLGNVSVSCHSLPKECPSMQRSPSQRDTGTDGATRPQGSHRDSSHSQDPKAWDSGVLIESPPLSPQGRLSPSWSRPHPRPFSCLLFQPCLLHPPLFQPPKQVLTDAGIRGTGRTTQAAPASCPQGRQPLPGYVCARRAAAGRLSTYSCPAPADQELLCVS